MQRFSTYYLSGRMVVPKNAAHVWLHMYCNSSCYLEDRSIKLYPTRYRVSAKTAKATLTNESITNSYTYDNPATNTIQNSYAIFTTTETTRYNPAYGEFRGNGMVHEQAGWTHHHPLFPPG